MAAMGWDGGHLHMFSDDTTCYAPDEEHRERLEWRPVGLRPAVFDLAGVNARLHGPV
jgi:hypothetical protein